MVRSELAAHGVNPKPKKHGWLDGSVLEMEVDGYT
jgi:hypothetical protein